MVFYGWREIWSFLEHKERVFSKRILIWECNAATQMKEMSAATQKEEGAAD